ncbi:autotransporter outer membrane beta-barrel domain-containing protein [Pseudomonas sp. v388]|nr:autotransporter outer membrane beta-barrel domain-containing protein [Pseudomonas sp. v388]
MDTEVLGETIVVDNRVEDVDGTRDPANYEVRTKGTLNLLEGAIVDNVFVTESVVNANSATIRDGLRVLDGRAIVSNTRIINLDGPAVSSSTWRGPGQEYLLGSVVELEDSVVNGVGAGGLVGPNSKLSFKSSEVFGAYNTNGQGEGVRVSGGALFVSDDSLIEGENHGIRIVEVRGSLPDTLTLTHKVVIHDSVVKGQAGAAIRVDTKGELADIEIAGGSTLLSGNGNLLEVTGAGKTLFKVDDSILEGDLVAETVSTLDVTLQNGAQLTGNIVNSNTLAINSGARWQMAGDNTVKSLSLDGGGVSFGDDGFHKLSLDELSGNGTFGMRVDLDKGIGDLLNVEGQANGNFGLRVRNTGVEVVSPGMQPLMIVHTEGGDAQFNLLGGRVDLGAYSYLLEQKGNDWFIVGDGKTTSPSTNTALALYNAAPSIWKSELSTLRTRMGEIRNGGTGGGSWMRASGNRLNASTSDGVNYRQQTSGLSLGADAPIEVSNGQLLVGVMGGYSKSNLDLSHGTKGKVDSYYVGGYGTWLLDDGYYLDGVLKFNRFRNKADVAMSDATKAKGDYANNGIGGSLEFGRHIKLADDYFLEPFAQLSTVVIQGDDYRLNNGLKAKNQRTQSVVGKVGTSAGRNFALKDGGVMQPYVRVAVAQEFSRSNDVEVNDAKFDNSLFGTRAELGAGVSVSLSERVQVHADFDYMKGKRVEQPWGANVGLRFAF